MSAFRKKPVVIEAMQCTEETAIETLEGTMTARVGDWIITGVKGERYPCKPDIFAATYEAVAAPPPPAPSELVRLKLRELSIELMEQHRAKASTLHDGFKPEGYIYPYKLLEERAADALSAAASRIAELEAEREEARNFLAGTDIASLPNDMPLVKIAYKRMEDRYKFMWQVRDTLARITELEAELARRKENHEHAVEGKQQQEALKNAALARITELEAKNAELEALFDLQWKADQRAIKQWREATGRTMVSPDRCDMVVWMLERVQALRDEVKMQSRVCEMSAAMMRDAERTGGWSGSERVARAFDRICNKLRAAIAHKETKDG